MEHIIQHFRKEEQPFIEKVLGWKIEVENQYAPKLTPFLDPREQYIVQSIIGHNDSIQTLSEGAFEEAERKRMMIYPSYFEPSFDDFEISVLELSYPSKFIHLQHRDILGALLSLGIDRNQFGDIRIDGERGQFVCTKEMQIFIQANLTQVGKAKIRLSEVTNLEQLMSPTEIWKEKILTVSSMRLDVVLANSLDIARQKSQQLIQGGKVKVNLAIREETSMELEEGDIISCRGFGRLKVLSIEGRTKKDKIRLQIGQLEQK